MRIQADDRARVARKAAEEQARLRDLEDRATIQSQSVAGWQGAVGAKAVPVGSAQVPQHFSSTGTNHVSTQGNVLNSGPGTTPYQNKECRFYEEDKTPAPHVEINPDGGQYFVYEGASTDHLIVSSNTGHLFDVSINIAIGDIKNVIAMCVRAEGITLEAIHVSRQITEEQGAGGTDCRGRRSKAYHAGEVRNHIYFRVSDGYPHKLMRIVHRLDQMVFCTGIKPGCSQERLEPSHPEHDRIYTYTKPMVCQLSKKEIILPLQMNDSCMMFKDRDYLFAPQYGSEIMDLRFRSDADNYPWLGLYIGANGQQEPSVKTRREYMVAGFRSQNEQRRSKGLGKGAQLELMPKTAFEHVVPATLKSKFGRSARAWMYGSGYKLVNNHYYPVGVVLVLDANGQPSTGQWTDDKLPVVYGTKYRQNRDSIQGAKGPASVTGAFAILTGTAEWWANKLEVVGIADDSNYEQSKLLHTDGLTHEDEASTYEQEVGEEATEELITKTVDPRDASLLEPGTYPPSTPAPVTGPASGSNARPDLVSGYLPPDVLEESYPDEDKRIS